MNIDTPGFHSLFSAVLATAIVGTGGLMLDRAPLAHTPKGVIEVGQPTLVEAAPQVAVLPPITVTATRLAAVAPSRRA